MGLPVAQRLAAALVALAAAAAAAQDRPSEDELFGGTPPARAGSDASPAAPAPPPRGEVPRDREDALKVGGQLYLRAGALALEGQAPADWRLASPNLLDTWLDARPNDRVRAFVLGRLLYDPTTLPVDAAAPPAALQPAAPLAGTTANPRGVLDQLWIHFDVGRRAFVTAGRQHAKWGVGRFWNPTDYLHPVRRDPLATFDARTGTTMVKVHVPWEARGWNLYGVAVLEDLAGEPPRDADGRRDGTGRLGRVGVGGRAEVVLGAVELGADALAQDRHRPRFGVDVSAGVWDLDLYAEAALRTSVDTPRWRKVPGADPAAPLLSRYERHDPLGFTPQLVAGATYAVKYSDEDAVTFGAEYFFDDSGYGGASIYPVLLGVTAVAPLDLGAVPNPLAGQPAPFTSFYLGRHYGGAFAALPAPGRWNDTNLTLSVLGNLSDKSLVARLDHNVLLHTYLRLETYVAGHLGARAGEFRLGFTVPPQAVGGGLSPLGFASDPMVLEAGVALRVSL